MKKQIGKKYIIYGLVVACITILAGFSFFSKLENFWYDRLLGAGGSISDNLVIIAMDDRSIQKLGQMPWDRKVYGVLIEQLEEAAVIGIDIVFSEPSNPESDADFAMAMEKAGNIILPVFGLLDQSLNRDNVLHARDVILPVKRLLTPAMGLGHINTMADKDSIIRQGIPAIYDGENEIIIDSFHVAMYKAYKVKQGETPITLDASYFNRPFIQFLGLPGTTIETISFVDCLEGNIPKEYFKDKMVLVGETAAGTIDAYYTPASGEAAMHGVEIHATIINNLLFEEYKLSLWNKDILLFGNRFPAVKINLTNMIFVLLFSLVAIIFLKRFDRLMAKSIFSVGYGSIYMLLIIILYHQGFLLQSIYPLLALLALYATNVIISYMEESREKHEIIQVFGRYMSDKVVEKIIEEGAESLELGGEKRDITVIFFDIRGFTRISEHLEAAIVVEMLNYFLEIPTEIIFKNEGMLDKYMGDSIMASFNVPYSIENHPYKAVKTAIEVQEKMADISEKILLNYGQLVRFGIGINTGAAIVGNIGSSKRMDYTSIGDTVNVASRLESIAKPNQILITEAVYECIKEDFSARDLGLIALEGRKEPVHVFEILLDQKNI